MVDRIGSSSLSREAILAAMRAQAERRSSIHERAGEIAEKTGGAPTSEARHFSDTLTDGVGAVDGKLKEAASTPEKMLTGEIQDFHEVAVQLRQADLSFRFAMEIRNKLIDAYREVMRMSV